MTEIAKETNLPRKLNSVEKLNLLGNDTNDEMDSDPEKP